MRQAGKDQVMRAKTAGVIRIVVIVALGLLLAMLLSAAQCGGQAATKYAGGQEAKGAVTPLVETRAQESDGKALVVAKVVSPGQGWVVVHADNNGSPGRVLGHAPVKAGENADVSVPLDEPLAQGGTLWAMLHVDAGEPGKYEFPGVDAPLTHAAKIVMQEFRVTLRSK